MIGYGIELTDEEQNQYVVTRKAGRVGFVMLNRPEKLNAFPGDGSAHLIGPAFERFDEDDEIKVIVFRGVGRAFSAGMDMAHLGNQYFKEGTKPSQRLRLRTDRNAVWDAIFNSSKVVIAEGKGYILGGALDFFMAADLYICAEGTVFGTPPARMIGHVGMNPAYLLFRMGPSLFAEIHQMGLYVTAEEMWRHGVVSRVVPIEQLEGTVQAAADAICNLPADGLAIGKLSKRIAYHQLGMGGGSLTGALTHTLQVQQKLDDDEWNLFRSRRDQGAKEAWRERDSRYSEALRRYNPNGLHM